MSNGLSGFLASATIVVTGLAGLWAWPAVQDGGVSGLVSRAAELYRSVDARLRPAFAIRQAPSGTVAYAAAEAAIPAHHLPATRQAFQVQPLLAAATPPNVPGHCSASGAGQDTAVVGDRVQLRIYETSVLAAAPDHEGSTMPTDIVFERLDLSGIYEISATGDVSLPAIGHVDVAGQSLPCIEAQVARAGFERLHTQNSVSATFAARPPILVRGAVRAPGAHSYSPGLTVERVLAQAGVLDDRDPVAQVRLITLNARRSELEKQRVSLALERLRIEAALANRDTLPDDDPAVRSALSLLGESRVAIERSTLATDVEADRLRQARSEATLADLATRIEVARRQQDQAEIQLTFHATRLEQRRTRLRNMQSIDARLDDTTMRAMDAERLFLDKRDFLLRLETDRRLAEHDADVARADRVKTLTAELRRLSAASDVANSEAATVLAELDLFEKEGIRLAVTIERPTDATSSSTLVAGPTTPVQPGDLITVSIGRADDDTDIVDTSPRDLPAVLQSANAK